MNAVRRDGPDLVLSIKVVPGARDEDIVLQEDCIRVRVNAAPRDGKANERLGKLLGRLFGVPPSDVIVERGQTSRTKRVRVRTPARVPSFLAN